MAVDTSSVYLAAEHIGSLIDEGLIKSKKVSAVLSELNNIHKILLETRLNNAQVCSLLAELRTKAYHVEDVVDTNISSPKGAVTKRKFTKKLNTLHKEIQNLKEKLLIQCNESSHEGACVAGARCSESSVNGHGRDCHEVDIVVGIEKDVEKLVKRLASNSPKQEFIDDVLAIVGMGGSGKTTLARNIYNHPKVKKHFTHQAWVSLSPGWTVSDVMSEIGNQINNKRSLIEYVFNGLRSKRCLLVLDNVWDCEYLKSSLLAKIDHEHNLSGLFEEIKIVITSRQYLDKCLKWCFHEVQLLGMEDGCQLLFKMVFNCNTNNVRVKQYKGVALELLKTCGGLPLAIAALGKVLKNKPTLDEWKRVASQIVPNQMYPSVKAILALSYHDLCYYLKPCFLYFGLFPEDVPIKAETMMKMWIAEGFVRRSERSDDNGQETSDVEARRLLQTLIDHTMVQVVKRTYCGKVKTLGVHDIMRDVCITQGQEIGFLTACSDSGIVMDEISQTIRMSSRRIAIHHSKLALILSLENPHLRSLLIHGDKGFNNQADRRNHLANLDLALLCKKFKLLRVLDINGIKIINGVMPNEIGNLIHLRYLRIRSTNIRELPKSIGKLRNLLTLDYWNVSVDNNGMKLPNTLRKLSRLRHMYLPYELGNIMDDFKIAKMKDLLTLWGVRGGNWMLKEMPKLNSNLRKLCIQGISTLEQMDSLLNSPVIKMHDSLYSLALEWYRFALDASNLEALCWKLSLKKIRLRGNAPDHSNPIKFPSNLGKLELYYTQLRKHESMEALGKLPSLKFLRLANDSFLGTEWIVGKEEFPQLEELKLSSLSNLVNWEIENAAMPCLKKLSIDFCVRLKELPQRLKTITTLDKLNIERMPIDFTKRLQPTNNYRINRIPNISIRYSCVQSSFSRGI